MSESSDGSVAQTARERQRRWHRHLKDRSDASTPGIRVGVAASFTAEPLEAQAGAALLELGFVDPEIRFADYNQIHQVCLDPTSMLGGDLDDLILLWRVEDVFERQFAAFLAGEDEAAREIYEGVAELAALIVATDATYGATLIVSAPPHPAGWGVDLRDTVTTARVGRLHREVLSIYFDALSAMPFVEIVDVDALQRYAGESRVFDAQKWAMYRQPYESEFWFVIGSQIAEAVSRRTTPPPKCIVLDCDNTLWGGVVGEDGLGGIELGDSFPGRAFQAFQRELKMLRGRGVMLAIASKNEESDVLDVFERHEGMVLTADDITTWRVNWLPKSQNLESIASELNIGADSLVLVDDSAFEVNEVSSAGIGSRCLLVPEELADLPAMLAESGLFRRLRISGEDKNRAEMMRSEAERVRQVHTMGPDEFLDSLGLVVTFAPASEEHVGRVAQLTNKTNQFNLTTIRRDEKQIRALVDSATDEVFTIRVTDRFGDYGLVGVAIVAVDGDAWTIDTLLMSCRVLGRGIESAFLSAVAGNAVAQGAKLLIGRYEPTRKNAHVADLYPNHGFERIADAPETFELHLEHHRPQNPSHIRLVI